MFTINDFAPWRSDLGIYSNCWSPIDGILVQASGLCHFFRVTDVGIVPFMYDHPCARCAVGRGGATSVDAFQAITASADNCIIKQNILTTNFHWNSSLANRS